MREVVPFSDFHHFTKSVKHCTTRIVAIHRSTSSVRLSVCHTFLRRELSGFCPEGCSRWCHWGLLMTDMLHRRSLLPRVGIFLYRAWCTLKQNKIPIVMLPVKWYTGKWLRKNILAKNDELWGLRIQQAFKDTNTENMPIKLKIFIFDTVMQQLKTDVLTVKNRYRQFLATYTTFGLPHDLQPVAIRYPSRSVMENNSITWKNQSMAQNFIFFIGCPFSTHISGSSTHFGFYKTKLNLENLRHCCFQNLKTVHSYLITCIVIALLFNSNAESNASVTNFRHKALVRKNHEWLRLWGNSFNGLLFGGSVLSTDFFSSTSPVWLAKFQWESFPQHRLNPSR